MRPLHEPGRTSRARRIGARAKGIALDTRWTGAIELFKVVSGFVVLAVLIRDLGPASYGQYVAVQALAAILSMLSSAWVSMLMLQHALQAGRALSEAYRTALGLTAFASSVAALVGGLVGPLLIPSVPAAVIVLILFAELFNGVLVGVSASAVQVARGLPAASRVRMLPTLTRVVVIVGIALLGETDLPTLARWLFIAYGTLGVGVFLWATHSLGLSRVPARPTWAAAREGLPYAGVLASSAVSEDSDKIFIVRFVDPVSAGLYAASYRIVQIGFLPIAALMGSSHPRFLTSTPGATNEHVRRALRYTYPTLAYAVVAALGIVVLAPAVPVVFGEAYEGTKPTLWALAPLIVFRALHLFPLNALLGLRRFTLRFFAFFSTSALNVVLNALLIPRLSASGAVLSTLLTEVFLIVVAWTCVVRSQRRHDRAQAEGRSAPSPTDTDAFSAA